MNANHTNAHTFSSTLSRFSPPAFIQLPLPPLALLCEPTALHLFSLRFNIQFIFSTQGTEQRIEDFHHCFFSFAGVICLFKDSGLYLDSDKNTVTITQ